MSKARLLVAEDDADMRDLLVDVLEESGYDTMVAVDGTDALVRIGQQQTHIDLIVSDVRMPGATASDVLAAVLKTRPEVPVIAITAFGSVEHAVEMVKSGAFQYLIKPFETGDLLGAVEAALESSAPQREQARLRREVPHAPACIVGASRTMRELFDLVDRAGRSTSTILITGESGTGKELVARAIHETSERRGAFVPVNCAAIPADLIESELFGHTGGAFTGARQSRAGLFEAANGGTLFLDEVGDIPLGFQPKLLRALQDGAVRRVGADREREVDVRIVAATNRDLDEQVRLGEFREDLYWRLNVIHVRVPPLRERPIDIPLLVEHFLTRVCEAAGRPPLDVAPSTLAILTAYSWPGNVRELENAVQRAVALARGAVLSPEDLPERIWSTGMASAIVARARERSLSLRELEREYILQTLDDTGGNKTRAAEQLGLDRKTLYRKLDEYSND